MFFTLITLLTALAIAGTAAWFSIIGLMSIFSASAIPILIMGSVLEVGKLVTASWVYRNWKTAGFLLKTYLTMSVVILMFITSMGIFGFLSKAHLDQASPVGNNIAKIERIDLRIQRAQREIDDAEKVVAQLDEAVNTLIEFEKISGSTGAIAVRKSQNEERQSLRSIVSESQQTIDELEDEKFELNSAVREIELEVGPVRYVAELIYDDASDRLDDAVRWVILILVVVFDPLAVLLLIAANQSLLQVRNEKEKRAMEESEHSTETGAESPTVGKSDLPLVSISTVHSTLSKDNQAQGLLDESIDAEAQKRNISQTVHSDRVSLGKAVPGQISEESDILRRESKRKKGIYRGRQIDGKDVKKEETQDLKTSKVVRGSITATGQAIPPEVQERQVSTIVGAEQKGHALVSEKKIDEAKALSKKTTPKPQDKKNPRPARKKTSNKGTIVPKATQEESHNEDKTQILSAAKTKDGIEPDKIGSPNWIRNKRD